MTVVKINVIDVPAGGGEELERRFYGRIAEAKGARGLLGYELLRPVNGGSYFTVTHWESEEDFRAFVARAADDVKTGAWRGAAQSTAKLLEFEVVPEPD